MASSSTASPNVPYPAPPAPPSDYQVGFVGLGNMGCAMALNLSRGLAEMKLPPLLIYNRTRSKADELTKQQGAHMRVADSVEQVGKECSLVFTSLSNDEACTAVFKALCAGDESVRGGGQHGHRQSKHHIVYADTSTIYPSTTGELERLVSSVPKRHFIAAPAFGPPPSARAGTLLFAIAGTYASKQALAPFCVPHMGRKILDFGSDPEKATTFKLIGNSMILGTIELLSETMTLADKTGVGSDRFYEFIQEFFPAPSALGYGAKIKNNQFNGQDGFTLNGGIKDCTHIRRLATSVDCPMPTMDAAHSHLVAARANGGGDKDWSSLVGGQRISAGLDPWEGKRPGLVKDE